MFFSRRPFFCNICQVGNILMWNSGTNISSYCRGQREQTGKLHFKTEHFNFGHITFHFVKSCNQKTCGSYSTLHAIHEAINSAIANVMVGICALFKIKIT